MKRALLMSALLCLAVPAAWAQDRMNGDIITADPIHPDSLSGSDEALPPIAPPSAPLPQNETPPPAPSIFSETIPTLPDSEPVEEAPPEPPPPVVVKKPRAVQPPPPPPPVAEESPATPEARPEYDVAVLQGLKKVTAETSTFEAPLDTQVSFGTLTIMVKKCIKSLPEERPENSALILIKDNKPGEEPSVVFSGWMFSSSPAISALEHPVYDVTMMECTTHKKKVEAEKPAAKPAPKPATGAKPKKAAP